LTAAPSVMTPLPAVRVPIRLTEAPMVMAPAGPVVTAPIKVELAPRVTAAPMHHVIDAQLAPFVKTTDELAAVLSAAGVEMIYEPEPLSVRIPVKPNAAVDE